MSSTDQPKPATRSSKRNKRPSSPVLEFLSNARKKRGGGGNKDSAKDAKPAKPSSVSTSEDVPEQSNTIESPVVQSKVPPTTSIPDTPEQSVEESNGNSTVTVPSSVDGMPQDIQPQSKKSFPFKNPQFTHLGRSHSAKKTKSWKSLKQILTTERTSNLNTDHITYGTIDAPPSFKPAKKYSDLSGFEAKYTDPQTKLHFSNPQEFAQLRILPSDTVSGLLSLRRANLEVS
ncbi:putative INO80 complex subunit C-like [Apostichopus japonicus]|uniref:Putative INO80 complex subunit C-like n=1 Tax=Stichopus japonicus TaxID=307972 RepID=A0A2G8JF87_STIJA|nr:putative INO80 complex subunit C-like [Apostichopus japonicus]